ncbi:hypothetical protein BOX15_Mlig030700g1 [Macrostomum lignano]|uniref:Calx-beta domain-containing protein n=1 Tax=Macrostomum lignano TaxID=282301 RepID=A0A267F6L7_9PLAT|nr:hypothetical protein BOX15_Mlig030700g1 [Macrostomum lignano]
MASQCGRSHPLALLLSPPVLLFLLLCLVGDASAVKRDANGTCKSSANTKCQPGVMLPVWQPSLNLSFGDKLARAVVYFSCLIYCFLGVSIIADRFMAAIEVITSKEKDVVVKMKDGTKQVVSVRIWNETVSNLTLMALGSSAPEILLSIIEICGKKFEAGDLGPGTIVGSAAFNLFIIIGLCVYVIPNGEIRRIKHLLVFFVTASFSVFAYLWMYMIIDIFSPGRVQVWEAVLTFAFFPLTVLLAYVADTKIFFKSFLKKHYTARSAKAYQDGELEMQNPETAVVDPSAVDTDLSDFEKTRHDYIEILREIRKKHPNADPKMLEEMAQMEVLNRGPKSRAFYRMQATRQLTGSGNVIKKSKVERRLSVAVEEQEEDPNLQKIFFDPGHYTVMENVGTFSLTVSRSGGDLNAVVRLDYHTVDGTATAGDDYVAAQGTLVFHSGEKHCQFSLTIIDDDVFEEDEHFYVELSNIRVEGGDPETRVELADPIRATIMVLDDDHAGIFHFEVTEATVHEAIGEAEFKVQRSSGARGIVRLPFKTVDGTAKGDGNDFDSVKDYLEFHNDETEKTIKIRIIDDEEYEKNEFFFIELGDPILMKRVGHHLEEDRECSQIDEGGRPKLGEFVKIKVTIIESTEFKNTVDRMLKKANLSLVVGTSSWKEQFIEAITVSSGDDEDGGADEDGEEKLPSCVDYVMHFLTIFWKLLFAFVPPTDYLSGWLCFTVSISGIGLLTALIGDLASSFGCTVGLTDAVTAITFVALGTSLPDTFASKVAAIGDSNADSSVGNVTGSNAVNVFLGIGVAWSIAAIYHWSDGSEFLVESGSLGFSVTVFCVEALVAIMIMMLRRLKPVGGELGGPFVPKVITTTVFLGLWVTYIILSALENYCYIDGF